jgi:hypothetical protein
LDQAGLLLLNALLLAIVTVSSTGALALDRLWAPLQVTARPGLLRTLQSKGADAVVGPLGHYGMAEIAGRNRADSAGLRTRFHGRRGRFMSPGFCVSLRRDGLGSGHPSILYFINLRSLPDREVRGAAGVANVGFHLLC